MTQPHYLENWKQYLTDDDYNYLVQYVENVKNNIPNDKMIILSGPCRTGKSTLKNNISAYLGEGVCAPFPIMGNVLYLENIKKLGFYTGIDEISHNKEYNTAIINLIKYKQSLIADTNHIDRVNQGLLEYSRIITMEHVF